jgi:hypothetical protein
MPLLVGLPNRDGTYSHADSHGRCTVRSVNADLGQLQDAILEYSHVGGAEALFLLKAFGDAHAFGGGP